MSQAPSDPDVDTPHQGLYSTLARAVSLLAAVVLSLLVFIYPKALAGSAADLNHAVLSLWMWGIAAGFVHGVGFVPRYRVWKLLLGPLIAWGFMLLGLVYLFWPH